MKVLFVPYAEGAIGHIIPLMALASKLDRSRYETVFYLPAVYHQLVKELGFNVLEIDAPTHHGAFREEMLAYSIFKPDIVVDDTSLTTLFTINVEAEHINTSYYTEELQVNRHIPEPDECENFFMLFKETLEKFIEPSSSPYLKAKQKLEELKKETEQTMASFNFQWVLNRAMEQFH